MADLTQLPVRSESDAEAIGFACLNDVPALPLDIPDSDFTIGMKTSDGRRMTNFLGVYRHGAAPRFVDIQYHNNGTMVPNANGGMPPTFDMFTIGRGDRKPMTAERIRGKRSRRSRSFCWDR